MCHLSIETFGGDKVKRSIFVLLVLMLGFSVLAQNSDSDGAGNPDKVQLMLAAGLEPYGPDSIAGSTLVATGLVQNGSLVDLTMVATNNSGDLEWLDRITVEFPAGWTVLSLGYADLGGLGSAPVTGGVGTNVATWTNSGGMCSGWGWMYSSGGQVELTVSVDTGVQMAGSIPIPWMMEGDTYGAEPNVLCSASSACAYDACYTANVATGADMLLDFEIMVPTLGTWGLGAFVVLLGLVAVIFARKKLA